MARSRSTSPPPPPRSKLMVHIEVSAKAYAAIVDKSAREPIQDSQRSPSGGYPIIVEPRWLDELTAQRQPGERLSDVIVRLAAPEVERRSS